MQVLDDRLWLIAAKGVLSPVFETLGRTLVCPYLNFLQLEGRKGTYVRNLAIFRQGAV